MSVLRPLSTLGVALVLMLAACGGDSGGGPLFGTDASGNSVTTTAPESNGDGGNGLLDSAEPLPIREGLGTYDNYVWSIQVDTTGPTAGESSTTFEEWTFNRDPESRISRTRSITRGPEIEGGEEESITDVYEVDGETCQWDGEAWTHTVSTDQEQEVLEAVQRLADIVIVPDNPVVVGPETVAGIPGTHYRFTVSGFGSESGALVTANQVDYWLSESGVVLKYTMVLESWSGPTDDPNSVVYRFDVKAELTSANVVVPVTLAPECVALPPEE
ncbi:MAG TPA: hypothetical protein VFY15_01635 [Acidimicrobiia bacterium]|nr:hypothetical protein [Acidimicrobiia bacterium]